MAFFTLVAWTFVGASLNYFAGSQLRDAGFCVLFALISHWTASIFMREFIGNTLVNKKWISKRSADIILDRE